MLNKKSKLILSSILAITIILILALLCYNKITRNEASIIKYINGAVIEESDDIKTIIYFGAKPDGSYDNKTAFSKAVSWLKDAGVSGRKLVIPPGRYFTSEKVNFSGIKNCTIEALGEIVSKEGILFSGDEINATFKQVTGDAKTPIDKLDNIGIYITATTNSNIKIDRITGYKNAVMLVGDALLSPKGVLYTTIDVGKVIRSNTACLVTTTNNPSGATSATAGFVNENIIRIRWMDTNYGISFVKGFNQYDRFNNNKIEYAGLEHISNDGISMEFAMGNLIYETRGEDVKGFIFNEIDCYANKYIISVPIKLDKVKLDRGVFYMGLLTDGFGSPFCQIYMKDSYGRPQYISTGGLQLINNSSNLIRPATNIINVNAIKQVDITMPLNREFEGSIIYVNAISKKSSITIKNSNNKVDIPDIGNEGGLYLLMYYEGKWHTTKLSDTPFMP
jgi:hypothetical protein